jgi:hypothetical protein
MNLIDLSEELLLRVMQFVDDTDIQTLAKVNTLFNRLSNDVVLWRYFHLVRNSTSVNHLLSCEKRPNRTALASKNILKGVQAHQIERGHYINGPNQQQVFETQARLNRAMKETSLRRSLSRRPSNTELHERGVLPEGINPNSSSLVARGIIQLRRAMLASMLKSRLSPTSRHPAL